MCQTTIVLPSVVTETKTLRLRLRLTKTKPNYGDDVVVFRTHLQAFQVAVQGGARWVAVMRKDGTQTPGACEVLASE